MSAVGRGRKVQERLRLLNEPVKDTKRQRVRLPSIKAPSEQLKKKASDQIIAEPSRGSATAK